LSRISQASAQTEAFCWPVAANIPLPNNFKIKIANTPPKTRNKKRNFKSSGCNFQKVELPQTLCVIISTGKKEDRNGPMVKSLEICIFLKKDYN
jgi:hypothetical protein